MEWGAGVCGRPCRESSAGKSYQETEKLFDTVSFSHVEFSLCAFRSLYYSMKMTPECSGGICIHTFDAFLLETYQYSL